MIANVTATEIPGLCDVHVPDTGEHLVDLTMGQVANLAMERGWEVQGIRACRDCGCTDLNACVNERLRRTCSWVEPDLCEACRPLTEAGWVHPPATV